MAEETKKTRGRSPKAKPEEIEFVVYRSKSKSSDPFVAEALEEHEKYVAGKVSVDEKATANQEWWRLRHLSLDPDRAEADRMIRSTSAWAVNSILNKHADIMDSFPKPNVLPREADDEAEAKILTEIVPVVLDHNDYEGTYRQMAWDFCIDGGAITSVLWDNSKRDGLGDISISNVDVHNLFWKPGVNDIQASPRLYHVALRDVDEVRRQYPDIAKNIGPQDTGKIAKYLHDDNVDYSQQVEVINMYYKRTVDVVTEIPGHDDDGKPVGVEVTTQRTILHLAIIVGDQLAFCSEREPGYERGFYEHGKYPFVVRRSFPVKDSPWGFGYLDIMKAPQMYIDCMDDDIMRIADMKARPRFWAKKNANISMDDFADWNTQIVEVGAGELGDAVRQMEVYDVPAGIMEHRANKIEELKETSGNRDFNQGGVSAGVTAASAVAALQEAGSKLSRDVNKELYRGAREEYLLTIELIRQFYTEPRSFRVSGGSMDVRFVEYSNAGIVEDDIPTPYGVRHRRPIFDISLSAEKASPFSRAAQNETVKELYGMGLFQPENALPALVCLDGMEFDGKDKIRQQIEQNSTILNQLNMAMQLIQRQAMADPAFGMMAADAGLIDPMQMQQMMGGPAPEEQQAEAGQAPGKPSGISPEERAARQSAGGENALVAKARLKALQSTQPR